MSAWSFMTGLRFSHSGVISNRIFHRICYLVRSNQLNRILRELLNNPDDVELQDEVVSTLFRESKERLTVLNQLIKKLFDIKVSENQIHEEKNQGALSDSDEDDEEVEYEISTEKISLLLHGLRDEKTKKAPRRDLKFLDYPLFKNCNSKKKRVPQYLTLFVDNQLINLGDPQVSSDYEGNIFIRSPRSDSSLSP